MASSTPRRHLKPKLNPILSTSCNIDPNDPFMHELDSDKEERYTDDSYKGFPYDDDYIYHNDQIVHIPRSSSFHHDDNTIVYVDYPNQSVIHSNHANIQHVITEYVSVQ